MTKRNTEPKTPDIREIRKEIADKALSIAKTLDETIHIGELNDDKYYLVIRTPYFVHDVAGLLHKNNIETKFEHRDMMNDDILLLLDPEPKDTEPTETLE